MEREKITTHNTDDKVSDEQFILFSNILLNGL